MIYTVNALQTVITVSELPSVRTDCSPGLLALLLNETATVIKWQIWGTRSRLGHQRTPSDCDWASELYTTMLLVVVTFTNFVIFLSLH